MFTKDSPFDPDSPKSDLTVGKFCNYVAGAAWKQRALLNWPPDVFALVGSLLHKSGAYCYAVSGWKRLSLENWTKDMKEFGKLWKDDPKSPPDEVVKWHRTLIASDNLLIRDMRDNSVELCKALLQLAAAADEACKGVGLAVLSGKEGKVFLTEASERLQMTTAPPIGVSTLCKRIHHSRVRVLPKLHTPQSGITIRSLTHNLALCPARDVKAKWVERIRKEPRDSLNLLLVPWPQTVSPRHFERVTSTEDLCGLPEQFGFFRYSPPQGPGTDPLPGDLKDLFDNALKIVPHIDGVVFPELALTAKQYETISAQVTKEKAFLIGGVREDCKNYLRFDIPFEVPGVPGVQRMSLEQHKHHRWRLDKRQIVQYGLGSCLDLGSDWWENIEIGDRRLTFVALEKWLTVCPLICEDLARQDPIAEIVREVGPNLVIALLMDGPQLDSRWPARYATVLADDPGSSVLTLTSVGMCELSRPPLLQARSRAVALWKDAASGDAVSIVLPKNKHGVVLSLSRVMRKEWTADGRDDDASTGYATLSGIHYVSLSRSRLTRSRRLTPRRRHA